MVNRPHFVHFTYIAMLYYSTVVAGGLLLNILLGLVGPRELSSMTNDE